MSGIKKLKNNIETKKYDLQVNKIAFRNIVTSKIYDLMDQEELSKTELATKMRVSKPAITNLLNGDRNLTLDKITEISGVMGYKPSINFYKSKEFDEFNSELSYVRYFEMKTEKVQIISSNMKITNEKTQQRAIEIFSHNWKNK